MEFKDVYVDNLPDAYRKSESSNNYKILDISQSAVNLANNDIEDIFESLDLENAYGKTLDLYGEMFNQTRGLASDAQYRVLIKSRIMRNLLNGSYNSMLKAALLIFNCNPEDFFLEESENPATVDLVVLPLASIIHSGFSASQAIQIIKLLVPIGVKVNSINLEGTFEFCDGENDSVYDENKGFAISEDDQSIGGFLGYLSSGDEDPLPI